MGISLQRRPETGVVLDHLIFWERVGWLGGSGGTLLGVIDADLSGVRSGAGCRGAGDLAARDRQHPFASGVHGERRLRLRARHDERIERKC
jgi:hypothetical protein